MAIIRFWLRRLVAQRLLGLAVMATLAFTIGALAAGPIYADACRDAISSSALIQADPSISNVRFQIYGGPTFAFADADAAITDAAARLPVTTVVRQGLATVRLIPSDLGSMQIMFRDGAEKHLRINGAAPGNGQVALPQGAADTIGAKTGDEISITGPTGATTSLVVSGIYESPQPDDPFWFGSRTPFPQTDSSAPPPMLVSRSTALHAASRLGLTIDFAWDVFLDLASQPYAQVLDAQAEIDGVGEQLRAEPALGSLVTATGLGTLIDIVKQRVSNLWLPILLVVLQIGAVTLAVLAAVATLLLTRQSFELAVLHSRGFSRRALLGAQAAQALAVSILAYPLGLLLGMALAKVASHTSGKTPAGVRFPVHLNVAAALLGLGAAVTGALTLLALSVPLVRRTVLEERRATSRAGRPFLLRLPVELIVLPLGVFAFIELHAGIGRARPGVDSLDPLVLAAPTLLLFGASFLTLRFLALILRRLDRRIGAARGLPTYLAGRRIGRSPDAGFATSLLLLLAIGLLFVSTSYRAISVKGHEDAAHTQVGADWNIDVGPVDQALPAIRGLPASTTAVMRIDPSQVGGDLTQPPTVLGIDPASYDGAAWWRRDYSATPLDRILPDLATPELGVDIGSAGELRIRLDVAPEAAGLTVAATVEDTQGQILTTRRIPLVAGDNDVSLELSGKPSRLMSITFSAPEDLSPATSQLSVRIRSVDADGRPISLLGWEPLSLDDGRGELSPKGGGVVYRFGVAQGTVTGGIIPAAPSLPALVSGDIEDEAGPNFHLLVAGVPIPIRAIATGSQFPSMDPNSAFVVVSVSGLLERLRAVPRPGPTINEIWARGSDPVPKLRSEGFVVQDSRSADQIEGILAQLPQSLAVGMYFTATLIGLGLVMMGVAAGVYFAQRRRDYEFAGLRAMGIQPGQIWKTLWLEQAGLLGFALVISLGLGYALLRLMMPYLSSSLGVRFPPPVLVVDIPILGISLGAVVVATAVAIGIATRVLLRSSVTGILRGEAE